MKFKYWIKAARLRTLPLAFSCILLSASLVLINQGNLSFKILLLTLTTTLLLQILSNFANDYGDAIKNADKNRNGEQRMVQSGKISKYQMKIAIVIFSILSLIIGFYLVFNVFQDEIFKILIFISLGVSAIAAAIKYTVGKSAYGYKAFGDLSVFIFFGIVGVIGSYYLNLNNMRDYENDKKNNKLTLVVKMGIDKSKIYHFTLLVFSIISFISIVIYTNVYEYIFSIAPLFFIIRHMYFLNKHHSNNTLDSQLKTVALSCFCCSVLSLIIGLVIS